MGQLDLSAYYMSAIAFLTALVAFLFYLLLKKGDEVKPLPQDTEAKRKATGATDSTANEGKVRQDLEAKLEPAHTSDAILDRIRILDQNMETRFKELGAQVNASNEVEKLRQEIESRFSIKFDKEAFTENDILSFLFSMKNILYRFERETESRQGDENLRAQARGYIAILNLAMAWARANGNDMVRKKVNELLPRAEAAFKRMNEL